MIDFENVDWKRFSVFLGIAFLLLLFSFLFLYNQFNAQYYVKTSIRNVNLKPYNKSPNLIINSGKTLKKLKKLKLKEFQIENDFFEKLGINNQRKRIDLTIKVSNKEDGKKILNTLSKNYVKRVNLKYQQLYGLKFKELSETQQDLKSIQGVRDLKAQELMLKNRLYKLRQEVINTSEAKIIRKPHIISLD